MFDELIRRWWIVALRGAVAMAFGFAVFLAPGTMLALIVSLFAVFAIAEGIFAMGAGLSLNWLSLFLEGVVGAAIGLFTWVFEPAAIHGFVYLITAWALVTGVLELVGALRLRKIVRGPMVQGEWLLGATGALTLAFGAALAAMPAPMGAFAWMLGGYAVISGALLVSLALNIRTWRPGFPSAA